MSNTSYISAVRANVPPALALLPVWLLWESVPQPGDAKARKIPVYISGIRRNGELDSPKDRAQLGDFEAAVAAYQKNTGRYAGLGIALGEVPHEDIQVSGIDLDDVIDADTGVIDPRAIAIMGAANSYTEVSPSGTGVKIFGTGAIGTAERTNCSASVEVYDHGRFFTVTGNLYNNSRELNDLTDAKHVALAQFSAPSDKAITAEQPPAGTTKLLRNKTLCSLAGSMRSRGFSIEAMRAALHAENKARFDPPLPADEIETMLAGAAKNWERGTVAFEGSDELAELWPDPVNILGEMSAPQFTVEDLPPILSEFPTAYAQATGFDPSLTLSAALAVAAAALSDEFQIVGDSASKWFQQPRLWIVGIGRPGCGKTPAQKAMLEPLWAIQRTLHSEYEREVANLASSDEKMAPPARPRLILGDTTVEALSEALRHTPRGLLIANDEFESWLGSLDMYRKTGASHDRGEWLRVFDGGPHTVERIARGSIYIENWGVSIITATTPAALKKLTRSLPEDGLLQRFMPIIGRSKTTPRPVANLEEIRSRYGETISRLYAAAPRAHKGCVPLSYDAQAFLQTWLKQNQVCQEAFGTLEPALESHLAKHPTLLLRITLTLHAVNIVNHEDVRARDPASFPVPLVTIQAAARFLSRVRVHATTLYLDRSGSEAYELARDTGRAVLARGWEQVARRDLIQTVRTFRKAATELQNRTLELFVELGWLRSVEGGYAKSTPARYNVNPRLAEKFRAIAESEKERRTVIRDVIAQSTELRRAEHA